MKRKTRDLIVISIIYLVAFAAGVLSCLSVEGLMLKCFVFDTVATVATFVFSVIFKNSSVYDAYWSLTPMVMAVYLFIAEKAFSIWQLAFLAAFLMWAVRLTANWVVVFTGFDYEDWRYIKFRNETPKLLWPLVNFFGIHYVPTLAVFAGMLPIFEILKNPLGVWALPGVLVILGGTALEFFADRQMHAFLAEKKSGKVCRRGLWNYTRHPNYLGEITVWIGVFLTMLPYAPDCLYCVAGPLSMILLFNVISIPLMEKRQLGRRPDYAAYRATTPRLIPVSFRKKS